MREYDFYVPGIMCATNCKPAIERALLNARGVHNYTVDVTRKRVWVRVNDNITPQAVIHVIQQKAGSKYQATLITEKENQIFNFGLTGIMLTTTDCRRIERAMSQDLNWPDIQSCTVSYATNVIRIKMVTPIRDPIRFQEVQTGLQASIQRSIQKEMCVDIIPPPLREGGGEAAIHFRKALINLGVLLLLMGGGSLLPLPVIGLITLGSMWLTAKETYIDAYKEAKRFSANMNTLIALGTITALFSSLLAISQSFAAIPMILGIIKLGQSAKARAQEIAAKGIDNAYQQRVDMLPYAAIKLDPAFLNEIRHGSPEGIGKIIRGIIHISEIAQVDAATGEEIIRQIIQTIKDIPINVEGEEEIIRQVIQANKVARANSEGIGLIIRQIIQGDKNSQATLENAQEITEKIMRVKKSIRANPKSVEEIIKEIIQRESQKVTVIKASEVKKGDLLLVREGKHVPADGNVFCEEGVVRQEAITGESTPCNVKTQSEVKCGSFVLKSPIIVHATEDGRKSWLAKMLTEVKNSASKQPPHPELINQFAKWFTPFILVLAMVSGLGWLYLGSLAQAVQVVSSVLLCACPCMIGLGGPIAYAIAIYQAFRKGVIVKNTSMLDKMGNISDVFVDKTGTVTTLEIESTFINPSYSQEWNKEKVIQYAAAVQQFRTHQSFADAFANENNRYKRSLLQCDNFEFNPQGVLGTVEGKHVIVGEKTFLEQKGIQIPEVCSKKEDEYLEDKKTVTYIAIDGKCVAVVASKHVPREGAKEMVEALQERGYQVSMVTGDAEVAAQHIAQLIGIAPGRVHFKLTPQDKARLVRDARAQGKRVLLLGDGANDREAMKEANVSIAMGTSANAASSDDVGMIVTSLSRVPEIEIIAKETLNAISQSYAWTYAYNLVALLAATGLLYPLTGIVLTPVMASFWMALSSVFVVLTASRLPINIEIALGACAPLSFGQHVKSFFSPTAFCRVIVMLVGSELNEKPKEKIIETTRTIERIDQRCPPIMQPRPYRPSDGSVVVALDESLSPKKNEPSGSGPQLINPSVVRPLFK